MLIVDARGMGVRTKVIPLMKAGGREPVFEATEDYVKTVLGQIKRQIELENAPLNQNKEAKSGKNASLSDFQRQIIHLIEANPAVSYDDIAGVSGKNKATVWLLIWKRVLKKHRETRLLLPKPWEISHGQRE